MLSKSSMLSMCYFMSHLHVLFQTYICVILNATQLSYFVMNEYVL
jgi:hypothetical protein